MDFRAIWNYFYYHYYYYVYSNVVFLTCSSTVLAIMVRPEKVKLPSTGDVYRCVIMSSVQHRQKIGGDICLTTMEKKETFDLQVRN